MDRFKQQGHQVKVTDVKRCSFSKLQENKNVADLLRASKKQITIQAKLSCCTPPHVKMVSHLLFSASAGRNFNFGTYYMAHNKTMMTKLARTCCRSK